MWRAPAALDDLLDAVARRVLPGVEASASDVRALSDLYNGLDAPAVPPDRRLAAQLRFFLPADLGKLPACLLELEAAGRLPRKGVLRMLDLGAGPGTASLGARIALGGRCDRLEVVAVDREARPLEVGRALHEAADALPGLPPASYRAVARDLAGGFASDDRFDLVAAQGLLSELVPEAREPIARAAVGAIAEGGAAVVIEPALRPAARALHRVRDAILASGTARVFAPCVRQGPCPALDRESDWCHEDRAFEPSRRLADLARRAGLRRSGLKFAYVTFVGDRASVGATLPGPGPVFRVVSEVLRSKGKAEVFLCGEAGRLRASLLSRDRSDANGETLRLRRGDLARAELGERARISTIVRGADHRSDRA